MAHIVELHPGDVLIVRTDGTGEPSGLEVDGETIHEEEVYGEVAKMLDLAGIIFMPRGIDLEAVNDPNLRALGLQRIPTKEKSDG